MYCCYDYLVKHQQIKTTFWKSILKEQKWVYRTQSDDRELIRDAKSNSKTLHITWFELQNAFITVHHDLVKMTLEYNNIRVEFWKYITNLYQKLCGLLVSKARTSE